MKSTVIMPCCVVLALYSGQNAIADAVITIRLSYKIILNPADGTRPPGATDANLDAGIADANTLLPNYYRGYRLVRVDPITTIGSIGGTTRPNPSYYYSRAFATGTTDMQDLINDAQNYPTTYAWNGNAVNVFIINGITGGHTG